MSLSAPGRADPEPALPIAGHEQRSSPPTLRVVSWRDPLVDVFGFDPRSSYVECLWLPLIGPTCTWLLRRLAGQLERTETDLVIDLEGTGRALGLTGRHGRNSPLARAITRCITFELARWQGAGTLSVRRMLPPLARRQLVRLPSQLQDAHTRWTAAERHGGSLDRHRLHARRLALGLVALGEPFDGAEAQLVRWGVHPALAHDAVAWARTCPAGLAESGRGPGPVP